MKFELDEFEIERLVELVSDSINEINNAINYPSPFQTEEIKALHVYDRDSLQKILDKLKS